MFAQRFPQLAQILAPQIPKGLLPNADAEQYKSQGQSEAARLDPAALNAIFPFYNFFYAKNGELTASQNGLNLHSVYNPSGEAARAAAAAEQEQKSVYVFAGFGLGYIPIALAKSPAALDKTFIFLEPDAPHFFAALASADFSPLFKIPNLFFAIGADIEQADALIQCAGGFEKAKTFCQKAQMSHAQKWFDDFFRLERQKREAAQANINTQERFGRLWLKNGARNLDQMQKLSGAAAFFGAADFGEQKNFPSVLIAAGPSLQDALPFLKKIHERAVTIAVDTALRACLSAGVEPDFIVLTDPQYWAGRHIAGLSAPHSILLAESAAYPSVFRFDCKKIILMSSLFPLGKFFEARLGSKGALASGGSVATSAWDFARALGSKEIFAAGLDLGYPNGQTHVKGSAFEEAAHASASRLNPAELQTSRILFSAQTQTSLDFEGNKIITDERMKLFALWFENKIAGDARTKTFSFSKKGLAIEGIKFCSLDEFLRRPKIAEEKKIFYSRAQEKFESGLFNWNKENFLELMDSLKSGLNVIKKLSQQALALCNDILCGDTRAQKRIGELDIIDKQILQSQEKDVAALVFPTQRQLDKLFEQTQFPQDPMQNAAAKSKVVYSLLLKSIEEFLKIC